MGYCEACGFVGNMAFDAHLLDYSDQYEETQGFSATFNAFQKRLAHDLIERYNLRGKTVLEIGCGKGEFLTLLCREGDNTGIGFDPAYIPERNPYHDDPRLTFIADYYGEAYTHVDADFIVCKMTLEHIPNTAQFMGVVRKAIGDRPEAVVFFQVPEVWRILQDQAFWDVYYEHCSYFSPASLSHLFRSQGFEVLHHWTDYDDQYLMIEARPVVERPVQSHPAPKQITMAVEAFADEIQYTLNEWRHRLRGMHRMNQKVVLWGGGSKAVAFLTTLGIGEEVVCAVDINPHKQGKYLPGTGHPVVGPEALPELQPDAVIILNPIYRREIKKTLFEMGLEPVLMDIDR